MGWTQNFEGHEPAMSPFAWQTIKLFFSTWPKTLSLRFDLELLHREGVLVSLSVVRTKNFSLPSFLFFWHPMPNLTVNTTHSILKICLKPDHYLSLSPLNHQNSFHVLFSLTPLYLESLFNRRARILLKYKSERSSLLLKIIQWLPRYSEQQTKFDNAWKGRLPFTSLNALPVLYPSLIALESPWCFCCSLLRKFFFQISPWFIPLSPLDRSSKVSLWIKWFLITIFTIAYCWVTYHSVSSFPVYFSL